MTSDMTCPAQIKSAFLGDIPHDPASELRLPAGIPGFERERAMLPVEIPAHRPLVFLQSLTSPDVCLVCLPVSSIDPDFRFCLSEEDHVLLGLQPDVQPRLGEDIIFLALLGPEGSSVRTNLDAPIVIALRSYRCIQAVFPLLNGIRHLTDKGWESC